MKSDLIERIDDGELLERNDDGTYSFISSEMAAPYKYTYERLMEDVRCKGSFRELKMGKKTGA